MAKQLNIDVNLNTAKATQQLQALQQALTQAISGASGNGALTREIVQATEAAVRLKNMLSQSMNADTGNLDLSKFSQQLTRNRVSLQDYARQLTALGPQGEKAFMQMSKAIVSAETPMRQSSKLMNNLWTTMKNTARWQISSAALHSFVGGLQSAMNYARGLNDSLNSIRIVTGQSVQEMDAFAQRANKSAKELSASTLDYTDAALIYYQQGIRDQQQIKERTDATIKMSNVTGESASKVSEELTAIWNNFADGSKNLEYYADVITALGANTASSSKEIAQGLSKFAAVADTVGLSYEYATSALATIVATTRQSADVVGTALKTLFARVQDLDLGKTLDDGTTLGKYSAALDAVGIAIKDQHGELRNMDDILDDMGSKWTTLNKDQQVALAQTVAGTRQYTQLVALMDNWDFMKENLMVAKGSEGELQKQADIYAESWKAAKDRVKASMQGIYDDLISDKFFIGLNDTLATALSGLDKFIDAIGGIPGVLGLVGIALTTVFKDQFGNVIEANIQRLKVMTGMATREANQLREQARQSLNAFTPETNLERSSQMEVAALRTQLNLANDLQLRKEEIARAGGKIAESEMQEINQLMEILSLQQQIGVETQRNLEQQEQSQAAINRGIQARLMAENIARNERGGMNRNQAVLAAQEQTRTVMTQLAGLSEGATQVGILQAALNSLNGSTSVTLESINSIAEAINGTFRTSVGNSVQSIEVLSGRLGGITSRINATLRQLQELREANANLYNEDGTMRNRPTGESRSSQQRQRRYDRIQAQDERLRNQLAGYEEQRTQVQSQIEATRIANQITQAAEATRTAWARAEAENTAAARQAAQRSSEAFMETFRNLIGENQISEAINRLIAQVDTSAAGAKGKEIARIFEEGLKSGRFVIQGNQLVTTELEEALRNRIANISADAGKTLTDNLMKSFNGLASLSMGISSLHSAINALNNEDLSFFEKFTQVTMSLGMGIPMLVTGLSSLGATSRLLTSGLTTLLAEIVATNTGLTIEAATAQVASQGHMNFGRSLATLIGLKSGYLTVTAEGTVVIAGETAANYAEASSFDILAGSIKRALVALRGWIVAHAGAIIAIGAVVGAVLAWKAATKQMEESTMEFKLKEAQENAKNLKSDLEQTKTAAENLAQAFDKYNSAKEALDNCAEGTKEWTDALVEANQAALDLISNYPDLAKIPGAITHDANGAIQISKEAQEQVLADAQKNVVTLQNATIEANKSVSDIQQRIDIKEWASSLKDVETIHNGAFDHSETTDKVLSQYTKGSLTDAGMILANNAEELLGLSGSALGDKMAEMLAEKGIIIDGNAWADILETSGALEGLYELGAAAKAAAEAQKAEREAMAKANLEANSQTKGLKNKDDIATILARQQDKNYMETQNYLAGQYENKLNSIFTDDKIQMAKDAVDILGGSISSTYYDKKDKVYKYDDASGSEKTLTKEEIASILASRDMQDKQTDIAPRLDNLIGILNKAAENGNVKAEGLKSFLTQGDLTQVAKKDIAALKEGLKDGEQIQIDDLIQIDDDDAKAFGFKTKDILKDSLTQDALNIDELFDTNLDGVNKFAKTSAEIIQRYSGDALSLQTEKQLGNQFDQLSQGGNSDKAMQNYRYLLEAIIDQAQNLPTDQYNDFFNQISSIDFSKTTHAFEALDNVCHKFGINLSNTGSNISGFNNLIQQATGQIISMKGAMESLTDIITQLKDLNMGDIVDEDFYNSLISQYPQLAEFFTENAEGQHILWGDAEKMASRATREAGELMTKGYELGKILQDTDLLSAQTDFNKTDDQGRIKSAKGTLLDFKQMNDEEIKSLWEDLQDNEGVNNLLSALGYTEDAISSLGDNAENTRNALQQMFDVYQEYGDADLEDLRSKAGEQLAKGATNIEDLNSMMSYGTNTEEMYASMGDLQQGILSETGWTPMIDDSAYTNAILRMVSGAESLDEAMHVLDQSMIDLSQTSPVALADSLVKLGEGYDTLKDEIDTVNIALNSGDDMAIAAAVDDLQRAEEVIAVAEALGETAEAADDAVDRFGELNQELSQQEGMLKADSEAATDAAKRFLQMNNAIDSISNNLKKYNNVLENARDSTVDATTPLSTLGKEAVHLQKDVANLIGTEQKLVKANTLAKISYEDLQGAADGNIDSINNVRKAFAQGLAEEYSQLGDLTNVANQFADTMESLPEGAAIDIDTQPFLTHLAQAMMAAGATASDIEAAFAGLNIDCDITPFYGTLEEAKAIAAETGDSFIESLGVDAEGRTQTVTNTGQEENVGFREQLFIYNKQATATVLEQDATTPTTVTLSYPEVHKQVAAIPMIEQTTEEKPITGVFVKNAHKSAGGKVGANSSKGGGGGCFVAGTLVALPNNNYKNIEDIKIGDIVLSYNEDKQQNEYSEVLETMIHIVHEEIYTLYIEDDQIQATGIHKFLINRNKVHNWIEAKDLQVGDLVLFADGTWHAILNIDINIEFQTVYNFEVSNTHNYYVGKNKILAHNKGGGCFIAGTLIRTQNGYKNIEDIKIGDIVLSYDEKLKQNKYQNVISTMIHQVKEKIYNITIENEILTVTGVHPFYILRNNWQGWLTVESLQIGDQVLFANGTLHSINEITFENKVEIVYNFEVANTHTYYVGINSILVHNKGCFIAGTQISTNQGYKNIEDIKINDIVLSYNEQLKQNEYNKVLRTMIHSVEEKIYTLYIENEIFITTGEHPFYISRFGNIGWLTVENLFVGDLVLFADMTWHKINKIEFNLKVETVYNFEVEKAHTYYVGNNQILVHNKGCFVENTLITMQNYYKNIQDVKIGDIVLSYNEYTNQNEYSKVLRTMIHTVNEEIYTLYIENEQIQATGIHPFLITRNNQREWIIAENLMVGDFVLFADGTLHKIYKIDIKIKNKVVYNFEVAKNHNYYVGKNQILAHNKGGGRGRANKHAAVQQKVARREGDLKQDQQHAIDKIQRQMDFLGKTVDRVYGKRRIDMQQKVLDMYGQELDKIKELNKLKEKEYKDSLQRIKGGKLTTEIQYTETRGSGTDNEETFNVVSQADLLAEMGLTDFAKYDADGYISNLEELKQRAAEWYNSKAKEWEEASADTQATDDYKTTKSKIEAFYESWNTLTDEISETYNAWQDGLTEWQDKLYEAHDMFAEMLKYKLEVRIDLIEGDLKLIDTKLRNIGDNIYKAAEALTLLWDSDPKSISQFDAILEKGQTYQTHWKEINDHYDPEKWQELDQLTQEAYIEQAQAVRDGVLEQAEALMDLREAYEAYYKDTLSKATEEIEKYTNVMEHNVSILEHLKNILDLTGREFDYEAQDAIIRARMSMNKDEYDVAADWAERTKAQYEAAKTQYEDLKTYDPLGAERFKKEVLDPSLEYFHEAEEKMYASAEELAKNINDLWDNTVESIKDAFEKAVTGGDGFDYLTERMERAKSLQEEYLTTTNKLYETNTLMRKVQKDMDNTDNALRKEKLASFNKEIKQAQEQNQLNKSSMEILKARYELLQAEMALEDAKDAKAIVRLQRDSEGNFGYVYTADQDQVDDAEQNLADKQNDLYNLVLNYQNEYQEKRLQAQREFEEQRDQIWEDWYNKRITDEQRDERLGELEMAFRAKMLAYNQTITETEQILNEIAAEGVSEAWSNSDADRMLSTDEFLEHNKEANTKYQAIAQETNAMRDEITQDTKLGLNDIKQKTNELTTSNEELAAELRNDVLPKLDAEIQKVGAATAQFERHATVIQRTIDEYLKLADAIQKVLREVVGEMDEPADYSLQMFDEVEATGAVSQHTMDKRSEKVRNNNMTREQYGTNNPETVLAAQAWGEDSRGLSKEAYLKAYREGTLPPSSKDTELQRMADMVSARLPGKTDNAGNDDIMDFLEGYGYQFEGMGRTYDTNKEETTQTTVQNKSSLTKSAAQAAKQAVENIGVKPQFSTTQTNVNDENYQPSANAAARTAAYEAHPAIYDDLFEKLNINYNDWLKGLSTVIGTIGESVTSAFKTMKSEQTLEQNVHITAEFPNVTSSDEVKEAILGLNNYSSQYANRT